MNLTASAGQKKKPLGAFTSAGQAHNDFCPSVALRQQPFVAKRLVWRGAAGLQAFVRGKLALERGTNNEADAHRFSPRLSLDGRTCPNPNPNPKEASGSSKAERTDGLQARGNGQKHQIVGRRLRCSLRTAWCCTGGNALFARARV